MADVATVDNGHDVKQSESRKSKSRGCNLLCSAVLCVVAGHKRTVEKPGARVFYISFVFSNARRVLSLCNIRLRLPCLLNIYQIKKPRPSITL